MAVLDGIVTVIGSAAEVAVQPYTTFPWAMLLNGAMGGIGFYALRIILLTVCLKLILSPLDFFQRYKMRKNQLITMRLKPQMEKLEKAYGGNPRVLQQKQAELNKREGMSYLASCLPMIVTLVVFMWLWSALRTNAEYKQFSNYFLIYEKYDDAYVQSFGTYEEDGKEVSWYDENADRLSLSFGDKYTAAFDEAYVNAPAGEDAKETAYASAYANAEVVADDEFGEAYFELFARSYADSFDDYVVAHTGSDTLREDAGEYAFLIASDKVAQSYCRIAAQTAAYDYFYSVGEYKDKGYSYDSFLWIRDIWSPDTPWSNSVAEDNAFGTFSRTARKGDRVLRRRHGKDHFVGRNGRKRLYGASHTRRRAQHSFADNNAQTAEEERTRRAARSEQGLYDCNGGHNAAAHGILRVHLLRGIHALHGAELRHESAHQPRDVGNIPQNDPR